MGNEVIDILSSLFELAAREPQAAIAELRRCEARFGNDLTFLMNAPGVYIDIGTDLGDTQMVEQGIHQLEYLARERPAFPGGHVFYNLGNGYSSLYSIAKRDGQVFDPDRTSLVDAKHWYRRAIADQSQLAVDLRVQLWVNYGNCLSGLGRSVDAISAYDQALALVGTHPMALGNMAIELHHYATLSRHPIFILDALEMLDSALQSDSIERYGGPMARPHFAHAREGIAETIKIRGLAYTSSAGEEAPNLTGHVGDYVRFCSQHHLFLNVCLGCQRCKRFSRDDFAFSMVGGINQNARFTRLARVINEIKEQYAFARFLLFQSQEPPIDTIAVDRLTSYIDNLDYGLYGTRAASLKTAFESAYGIFDKIAYFLDDYLELRVKPETKITFSASSEVWRPKGTSNLRGELLALGNHDLFALYDMARDFHVDGQDRSRDGFYGHIRRIRNRLAHEYVVPHIEPLHWTSEADRPECHLAYEELVSETVTLMKLARTAVIYLIGFIDQEERRKTHAVNGPVGTIEVTWYDADLFGRALG